MRPWSSGSDLPADPGTGAMVETVNERIASQLRLREQSRGCDGGHRPA